MIIELSTDRWMFDNYIFTATVYAGYIVYYYCRHCGQFVFSVGMIQLKTLLSTPGYKFQTPIAREICGFIIILSAIVLFVSKRVILYTVVGQERAIFFFFYNFCLQFPITNYLDAK